MSFSFLERPYPPPPPIKLGEFEKPPEFMDFRDAMAFNEAAWRVFVTLNWPVDCKTGKPLSDDTNYGFGKHPAAPRIWEFYRTPEEVFLPGGAPPLDDSKIPQPDICQTTTDDGISDAVKTNILSSSRILSLDLAEGQGLASSEKLDQARAYIHALNSFALSPSENSSENLEFPDGLQASEMDLGEIPLVDQQGNYILVEIHLNPGEFNQILDHQWYKASKLEKYNNRDRIFQFQSKCVASILEGADAETCVPPSDVDPSVTDLKNGTGYKMSVAAPIEIKAAWRIMDDCSPSTGSHCLSTEQKQHYYRTRRVIAIPKAQYICAEADNCSSQDPVLQTVEVGLLGFHIAYKIPEQEEKVPGWIWATFIHDDWQSALSNEHCQKNCDPNYPYVKAPYLWYQQAPHAWTRMTGQLEKQLPTQVELNVDYSCDFNFNTKQAIIQQNKNWRASFRKVDSESVWQYYQQVGAQWSRTPSIPHCSSSDSQNCKKDLIKTVKDRISPAPLVNPSLEPYNQLPPGICHKRDNNSISCIACHVTHAHLPKKDAFSDFSFLLSHAQ
ncbi:MAG: hypothetical protein AAF329_06200 [Cyanobacteria bacterium P01_A01_bin.17]